MDIQGERRLIAGRDGMKRALNDMEVLRECIPGCQKLERVSETVIEATIAAQIGPVKAPFASRIELKDLDPPRAYTLVGEGKSAAAGFGRGEARVTLAEEAGVTTLRYTAELKLGGKSPRSAPGWSRARRANSPTNSLPSSRRGSSSRPARRNRPLPSHGGGIRSTCGY